MNASLVRISSYLLVLILASQLQAAESFSDTVRVADELRNQQRYEPALDELRAAVLQADSETDRGIALGKQAEICAFHLAQYERASKLARQALSLENAEAVSKVISLKALAHAQIKGEQDYQAAIVSLKQASVLQGVDWAQPTVLLMLGDCYRSTDNSNDAINAYFQVLKITGINKAVSAVACRNLGLVYQYDLNQPEMARKFYTQATQLNPELSHETDKHPENQNSRINSTSILVHYMPWYQARPFSERWGWHWTMNHFDPEQEVDSQREIASKYYPLIGPYDSGDPAVLEYHLLTMKMAGIEGVIVDWYGLTDFRDYAILHRNTTRLLEQCERLQMKFAICYEDQTVPALIEANRISSEQRVPHVVNEINWLGKYWFQSGSYLRWNDQPVLLSFGHAGLNNSEWEQCISRLELPVAYFSQGMRRDGAMGGFGWPSPKAGLEHEDRFLAQAANWPAAIPAAYPRFDDIYQEAGVNEGYPLIADGDGKTFEKTFSKSLNAKAPIVQIVTWNDWGEGTQIEPSVEFGYRDLEHVQSVLREQNKLSLQPEDLRLPYQLLRLRRSGDHAEEAGKIATAISHGELEKAWNLLEHFSPEK